MTPEHLGGEVGIEVGERLGDLRVLDRGIVDRRQAPRAKGAGHAAAGAGVQGRGLEAADRNALRAQRDHADDLGVVEAHADGVLERELPDLPRLRVVGGARFRDPGHRHRERSAEELGLLDLRVLLGDRPQFLMGDLFGLVDVGQLLAAGRGRPGHQHRRPSQPCRGFGQSHGQAVLD
jgi:hypothetical protein